MGKVVKIEVTRVITLLMETRRDLIETEEENLAALAGA